MASSKDGKSSVLDKFEVPSKKMPWTGGYCGEDFYAINRQAIDLHFREFPE